MKKRNYAVTYDRSRGLATVTHKPTGKQRTYAPAEFIYGQGMHNPATDKLPDYIHGDLWRLIDGRP